MSTERNLETAYKLLKALENFDVTALPPLYHPDAVQIEWPNRLKPKGDRRNPAQMGADFEKSKGILLTQRYDVSAQSASGDTVALEYTWTGRLAIPVGGLAAGDEMRGHCALFMEFRDGLIVSQRNYDCFDEA